MHILLRLQIVFILILVLCGCSSVKKENSFVPLLSSIEITAENTASGNIVLIQGVTKQFYCTGEDQSGNPISIEPSWNVVGNVGAISPTGLFRASTLNVGPAFVVATVGEITCSKSFTVTVNVDLIPVLTSIVVSPNISNVYLYHDQQFEYIAYDQFSDEINVSVNWNASSNIGSIDSAGLFTANSVGAGSVIVGTGNVFAEMDISVIKEASVATSLSLTPVNSVVTYNSSVDFDTTIYDQYGEEMVLIPVYSVIGGIGSIDSDGLFTAQVTGDGKVRAELGALNVEVDVTVFRPASILNSITISPNVEVLYLEQTKQYEYKAYDQFDEEMPISLSWSSQGSMGSIDGNGLFSVSSLGSGSISVGNGQLSKSQTINVSSITFDDSTLEDIVRTKVNNFFGELTFTEMQTITELDLYNKGITDLGGIEACTQLVTLNLLYDELTDISVLSDFSRLEYLSLGSTVQIGDLSLISSLNSLISLTVYGQNNLGFLSGMRWLKTLNLSSNSISDIGFLSAYDSIEKLSIESNSVSDISMLSGKTTLKSLSLYSNSIVDISSLSSLTGLTELILWDNGIENITALSSLSNLIYLDLDENSIAYIAPLETLTGLDDLFIENNGMDITPGSDNAGVVSTLVGAGCNVEFDAGNTTGGFSPSSVSIKDKRRGIW